MFRLPVITIELSLEGNDIGLIIYFPYKTYIRESIVSRDELGLEALQATQRKTSLYI